MERTRQYRRRYARIITRYPGNRIMSADVLQTSLGNSNSSNQPSPGDQPHSSSQPGIGMEPSTGPLVGALQAVQKVQGASVGQTDSHMVAASVNYGEGNPVGSSPIQRTEFGVEILKRYMEMENRKMSADVLQTSLGNSSSSNQPSSGDQPHSSPHTPQPGIGMEPSTGPPVGALQAVQLVQAAAAGQIDSHMVAASVNYGESNPVGSSPIPRTGLMTAIQQMEAQMLMLNMGNVACWEDSGCAQNLQFRQNSQTQPNPQLGLRQPIQLKGDRNKQQQHLLAMQRQQQQQPNQFPHPQPSMYPQHPCMPIPMNFGHQQGFQGDNSQFQFQQQPQQILMQPQIKQMVSPTYPPVSPHQGILGHPQGPVVSPQQQLL